MPPTTHPAKAAKPAKTSASTAGAPLAPADPPPLTWSQAAFDHLTQRADPTLAAYVRSRGIVARATSRDYFARLARAIVGQQISAKAATSIYTRVLEHAGDPLMPQGLQAVPDDALRACGLSQAKLLALRDLAAHALDGRLDLAHLDTLPNEEVTAQLIAVRGIGPWTAEMFMMFALGRPDILAAGDLGIQNAVKRLYTLNTHPTPADIRQMAQDGNWHPYATAACFYLWDSLSNTPA
jgi:DNA-3-methyladenine glycosylase II